MSDFLQLSKDAFDAATTYIDANYRVEWDYSLKAFRSEHAAGSKYLSEDYKSRSRLFRPKTRSIVRKNEAAGVVALFSNIDVVNMTPGNPDDLMSVASCEAMKAVLEYRLTRTIPSFQVAIGGIQDAQVTGTVCSYQYWEYEKRGGEKVKDQPCIELRPIENIRLDAGASWLDPVGTSPYFCDIIPMYVCDVRAMMKNKDEKTGKPKWKAFEDADILKALPDKMDTTRKARLGKQQDPQDERSSIKAFDIVWVMRWFMRDSQGDDYTYYTLGTEEMLTAAKPLDEVYFHGKRPYVMGYAVLETHKALKTSLPMLTKQLQQETNDVANQRIDNVKFVLNKRWLVARGRQVDVQSLVRNVPGGVTLTTDPKTDVQESNWPDVTSSSYAEQDRLNSDFDDISGNFSASTKVANNAVNDTLGGSRMANQQAGMMADYMLRTIIETWWEPVLRQLVLLEQYYETDSVVLGIAAKKARLFPRFGLSQVTDDMLTQEMNLNVNVGMGASNPNERMNRFLMATKAVIEMVNTAPPTMNVQEIAKEIYSNAGMRDGARFMSQQVDPRLAKAMQAIQQLQGQLQSKQMDIQAQGQIEQLKIASNEKIKSAAIQVDQARISGDLQQRHNELSVEAAKGSGAEPIDPEMQQLEKAAVMADIQLKNTQMQVLQSEPQIKQETELQKVAMQGAVQIEIARIGAATKAATDGAAQQQNMDTTKIMQQLVDTQSELLKTIGAPKRIVTGPNGERRLETVVQ